MGRAPLARGPLGSRPVSRILSLGSHPSVRPTWTSAGSLQAVLLGLASGGVCPAAASPRRRCALTAPFHPYLCHDRKLHGRGHRRCVSVALSRGFPRVGSPTTSPCDVRTFLEGCCTSAAAWPAVGSLDVLGGSAPGLCVVARRGVAGGDAYDRRPGRASPYAQRPRRRARPRRRLDLRHASRSPVSLRRRRGAGVALPTGTVGQCSGSRRPGASALPAASSRARRPPPASPLEVTHRTTRRPQSREWLVSSPWVTEGATRCQHRREWLVLSPDDRSGHGLAVRTRASGSFRCPDRPEWPLAVSLPREWFVPSPWVTEGATRCQHPRDWFVPSPRTTEGTTRCRHRREWSVPSP